MNKGQLERQSVALLNCLNTPEGLFSKANTSNVSSNFTTFVTSEIDNDGRRHE